MINIDPKLELFILGGVVLYILYTYWRLIGTKTDYKSRGKPYPHVTIVHQDKHAQEQAQDKQAIDVAGDGLYVFEKHFPDFNVRAFLEGASAAFKMIVEAFAQGNKKALKPLLSAQLFRVFCKAIDQRNKRLEKLETTVMHVNKVICEKASIKKGVARGQFRILSSQLNKLLKADGTIEETSDDAYDRLTDLWTFEKKIVSSDPNWTLIAAESADASEV